MTVFTSSCPLCGVTSQADKDCCGEPDCPEQDEYGWVFLDPINRAGDDPGPIAPGHVWVDLPGGGETLRRLDG